MPICPKCGKLISESHFERHVSRCGHVHKRRSVSPYVQEFTGSIDRVGPRGILLNAPSHTHPSKKKRRVKKLLKRLGL